MITFQKGLTGNISLAAALPTLVQDMTIKNLGRTQDITISRSTNAMAKFRIFRIASPKTVVFQSFAVQNERLGDGQGNGYSIYNEGILTLADMEVSHNKADDFGGGIANTGNLELKGTTPGPRRPRAGQQKIGTTHFYM